MVDFIILQYQGNCDPWCLKQGISAMGLSRAVTAMYPAQHAKVVMAACEYCDATLGSICKAEESPVSVDSLAVPGKVFRGGNEIPYWKQLTTLNVVSKLSFFSSQRSGNEESISTANPSCEIWGLVFGFLFSVPLSVVEGLSSSSDSHITNLQSVQDVLEFVHYFSMLVAAIVVSVIILKHVPSQVRSN